jgi:hypothetical protein
MRLTSRFNLRLSGSILWKLFCAVNLVFRNLREQKSLLETTIQRLMLSQSTIDISPHSRIRIVGNWITGQSREQPWVTRQM